MVRFELKKELAHISQGCLDIDSYFNKIKQLWDEIASYKVRVCTCGGVKLLRMKNRSFISSLWV